MSRKIHVMLVEDNPEYRNVIHVAMRFDTRMDLTHTVGTAERALSLLQRQANPESPDIILLDLCLPGMSGLEAIPLLHEYAPKARIIILSQSGKEADVLSAISQGASGYLRKSATVDEITEGICCVMDGGAALDTSVASFILDTLKTRLPKNAIDNLLTVRELEILSLLGDGLVKKEIAAQLEISYTTVDTHVAHIYEKLDVRNAPSAIAKAFRTGILPPEK